MDATDSSIDTLSVTQAQESQLQTTHIQSVPLPPDYSSHSNVNLGVVSEMDDDDITLEDLLQEDPLRDYIMSPNAYSHPSLQLHKPPSSATEKGILDELLRIEGGGVDISSGSEHRLPTSSSSTGTVLSADNATTTGNITPSTEYILGFHDSPKKSLSLASISSVSSPTMENPPAFTNFPSESDEGIRFKAQHNQFSRRLSTSSSRQPSPTRRITKRKSLEKMNLRREKKSPRKPLSKTQMATAAAAAASISSRRQPKRRSSMPAMITAAAASATMNHLKQRNRIVSADGKFISFNNGVPQNKLVVQLQGTPQQQLGVKQRLSRLPITSRYNPSNATNISFIYESPSKTKLQQSKVHGSNQKVIRSSKSPGFQISQFETRGQVAGTIAPPRDLSINRASSNPSDSAHTLSLQSISSISSYSSEYSEHSSGSPTTPINAINGTRSSKISRTPHAKKNIEFQSLITKFPKEDEVPFMPKTYHNIKQGLMEFQLSVPKKGKEERDGKE
ncbi:DEKNAAC105136 [Brettanomyces naardenensis]|uniref:DEKNAAC105136 n=1 Tax=Brettanomyces naardenensis TaxID=13370 RepID=A0A448YSK0_BRENA|nr:DEKNAAC105136 [Brettanomyces naardenensis]